MAMTQVQKEKFTAVLKELSIPEASQTILLAQADEFPAIADGYLRQAEASRLMSEAKESDKKAKELLASNQDWYDKSKATLDTTLAENKRLKDEVVAKTAAAAAAATGGEHVDQAGIEAIVTERLKGIQAPSAEQIATVVAQEVEKAAAAARKDFNENVVAPSIHLMHEVSEIVLDHRAEFNERLDRKVLSTYMTEHQINDPRKAYDEMVAPRRNEKTIATKVAEGVQTELAKRAAESLPGTGAYPSSQDIGPVQALRAGKSATATLPADARLGDGSAASAAASELVGEGKF